MAEGGEEVGGPLIHELINVGRTKQEKMDCDWGWQGALD